MIAGANAGTTAARAFIVGRIRGDILLDAGDTALVASLIAGPTGGRVHSLPFPDMLTLPAIGFNRYGSSGDVGPIGSGFPSVATNLRFQVKAIIKGFDETPIIEAAAIVDKLLDGKSSLVDLTSIAGSLGTYYVESYRESELLTDLPTEQDGTVFQQLGGIYEFLATRV